MLQSDCSKLFSIKHKDDLGYLIFQNRILVWVVQISNWWNKSYYHHCHCSQFLLSTTFPIIYATYYCLQTVTNILQCSFSISAQIHIIVHLTCTFRLQSLSFRIGCLIIDYYKVIFFISILVLTTKDTNFIVSELFFLFFWLTQQKISQSTNTLLHAKKYFGKISHLFIF